ncbi:DUF262 domain-containing protein [Chitinophaga sp. CF418]|uniref:DUF262 domain-containing protein n=1 Tax=Chitinophaga sp. CF418 TaxID=1855287 RepID=UPI00091678AB|nr:DUF262 domain-containing protein [Chitinophaga sp. CF418]SHN43704.1 Protein of unknown function DUF262 [Chitinophaga sp. CF418]
MESIRDIFTNKFFRIPDYQRGYSWEISHVEDFWQDLLNLQRDRMHYTGMISVEEILDSEYWKLHEDAWLIGRGDKPFFIVDGQQRMTTVVILISVLLNYMEEGELMLFETKNVIANRYLYTFNPRDNFQSFLFGYHKDNPSYEYLKREIFEQANNQEINELERTSYTNNLFNAKQFFDMRVQLLSAQEREEIYEKVVKNLKFDFKILEKQLDIFIVFETMNNRGKALSNLEKLKNRLIYLSTLLSIDVVNRIGLRDRINETWKIVYRYLGMTKDRRMDDDAFLQNHWIMYSRYDRREPEFYVRDIFERNFSSQRLIEGSIDVSDLDHYIISIAEAIKCCFVMYNPNSPLVTTMGWSWKVLRWLKKLNRLGYKSFGPLIMAAMMKVEDEDKLIRLLSSIEAYIFLLYNVSFRRSNTGTYHFNAKASELYNDEIDIDDLIIDINFWIYGDNETMGYFDFDNFYSFLNDAFRTEESNGYLAWKHIRYFLYEYEEYLGGDLLYPRSSWTDLTTVYRVMPSRPVAGCWRSHIEYLNRDQQQKVCSSLGNLILMPKIDVQGEEYCFKDLKQIMNGMCANADDVFDKSDWTPTRIESRGIRLLEFMEERWNIPIGDNDMKRKILFLDYLPPF